jgi:hypothetical protein
LKPRLKFVVSQAGIKSGKKASLAMLLDVEDLSGGGWKKLDERTWRTGSSESDTERSNRAREIGSITAWRAFERHNSDQSFWVQLVPFASRSDAETAVRDTRENLLPNLRQNVTIASEQSPQDVAIVAVENPWIYEQHTVTDSGQSCTKIVSGRIEQIVMVIACSGTGEGWTWPEVQAVISSQSEKVRRVLGDTTSPR